MKIAILGFAGQGLSSYNYWNNGKNDITIHDMNDTVEVPNGVKSVLGKDYLQNLDQYDLLIRTPFLHPRDIVAANPDAPDILDKVTSNTNEFFAMCPTKNIIGVTGTKGKGTTSTLIAKILEKSGKTVHLGGNIGTPPLDLLPSIAADDWVVLELANFQLIDIKHAPHIAVCLMMVPEHMDWHEDFEEYVAAKQQLFINQDETDIAIYYALNEDSQSIADASMGIQIPYMEAPGAYVENDKIVIDGTEICAVSDIKLLGKHNWQNVCAAITATWQITQDIAAIKAVLTSFTGMEYRLEKIAEIDDITYYNDSFGTTPETAIVAIEAFTQPKVVILGGSDKKASFEALAKTVADNNVRTVVTIGITGPAIQRALDAVGYKDYVHGGDTMQEIVDTANTYAQPGDIVLLSTGCASFGLFKNYKDRGNQFNQVVRAHAVAQ